MKIGFIFRIYSPAIVLIAVLSFTIPSNITAQIKENDSINSLYVKLHPQETENWCWAACGQMIMEYLGHKISQCEQANNRFERTECCQNSSSPIKYSQKDSAYFNCARPGWPEFEKYGIAYKRTSNSALTWDELKAQLSNSPGSNGKPFAFSWRWKKGGGHMMVAIGYAVIDNENYVIVLDPWPANKGDEVIITYSAYVEMSGSYTHWDDLYDFAPPLAN